MTAGRAAETPRTGSAIAARIPNVGLHVADVDESLPFYRDLLGMHVVVDSGWLDDPELLALTATPGGAIRIVNLATPNDGGATITLVGVTGVARRPPPGGEFHDPGTVHLAIETVDLDAALATLTDAGVPVVAAPGEVSGGGPGHARVAFLRDPNGFFVELVQKLDGAAVDSWRPR
jgi:catechol 2,3-dioxygenase-like lactoylglutathione lyase family enzyme